MLRVRIELVPFGQETRTRTLQTLTIVNVGGTDERGVYDCHLMSHLWQVERHAHISDWPRLEKDAAALVHEALSRMGYGGEE